jgi:hypothetical protein
MSVAQLTGRRPCRLRHRPQTNVAHAYRITSTKAEITIRQLSGAKGLAAALRADGVPAYVGFASPAPATCQGDPTPGICHYRDDALIINPSAITSYTTAIGCRPRQPLLPALLRPGRV